MGTEIITTEEQNQLTAKNNDVVAQANALKIKTEVDNNQATKILKVIKEIRVSIEEKFSVPVKSAKKAYDDARELRDSFLDPLKDCESSLRAKIGEFVLAEQTRREALQAKEDAKFAKAVEKSETTGKPLTVAPVVIQQIKGQGSTSFSTSWYAEVVDIKALCRAVAEGLCDPSCVEANMTVLNGMARAIKRDGMIVPGVETRKKTVTRV